MPSHRHSVKVMNIVNIIMEVNLNLQYRAINNQLQTQFLGENTYIDQYLHGTYYCLAFYEILVLSYYCI